MVFNSGVISLLMLWWLITFNSTTMLYVCTVLNEKFLKCNGCILLYCLYADKRLELR